MTIVLYRYGPKAEFTRFCCDFDNRCLRVKAIPHQFGQGLNRAASGQFFREVFLYVQTDYLILSQVISLFLGEQ